MTFIDPAKAWENGRPIYHRLPGENEGYLKDPEFNDPITDPPIADWLTQYWDALLMDTKAGAEGFYDNYLNPATALPEALDWLAQFFGFTGPYWDASWTVAQKRQLLSNALSFIWENKGTERLFYFLFGVFGLQASIYRIGDFLFDVSTWDSPLGSPSFTFFVRLPLLYLRTSAEWALAQKLVDLYAPAYSDPLVCFDSFYWDFSAFDDPLFD